MFGRTPSQGVRSTVFAGVFLAAGVAVAALPTYREVADLDLSYAEVLAGDQPVEGSASIGTTLSGRLVGAAKLAPEGPDHRVLPGCRERQTNYGTEELIRLVLDTARTVQQTAPGPRLAVCNLSRDGGGAMSWSQSHNSGRDVDLAFFVRDIESEQPVDAPRLMAMSGKGIAFGEDPRHVFDVPRNWQFVRALLGHPSVVVQWILVDRRLKRLLLDHAATLDETDDLLERADSVLHQPTDARRHNDHFHVRIFCAWDDRAEGCLDVEPLWPWRHVDPIPLMRRTAALSFGLRDPKRATRRAVLEHLATIEGHGASPALAEMAIMDPDYTLRGRAGTLLLAWRVRDADVVDAITRFIRAPGGGLQQDDADFTRPPTAAPPHEGATMAPWHIGEGQERTANQLHRAYKLLAKLASPHATPFVGRALTSTRRVGAPGEAETSEARLATKVAIHVMDLALVPTLLDHLTHPEPRVRVTVDLAIRRITNHVVRGGWGARTSPEQLALNARRWREWWSEHQDWTRDEMLSDGFKRRGHRFVTLDSESNIRRLIALTKRTDEIGYNADRMLVRITRRVTPRGARAADKHRRWLRLFPE